jgi:transcriptional regulator with XRE-family HTH domain
MDLRRTFAANVVRLRAEKGISQEELAYEVGMNRAHLSEIETGKAYVGLEILGKIADVLGVEGADLLTRDAKGTAKRR